MTLRPLDFESSASANSATLALTDQNLGFGPKNLPDRQPYIQVPVSLGREIISKSTCIYRENSSLVASLSSGLA